MSVVVLRCPQCGSVQDLPGECGTCHDADVRYFCANHTPGRWLDAPSCPECGAHLGFDPASPGTPPKGAARRPTTPPPLRPPGPRPTRPAPPPAPPIEPPVAPPRTTRPTRRPERPERPGGALPPWLDLPPGMPPRRRGRARATPDVEMPIPRVDVPPGVRIAVSSIGGCALRLVLAIVLLVLLALGAGFLWVVRG